MEIGRYKAVDDLLAHNVESFSGMQQILFGRALEPGVRIHFEFLDNNVPRGNVPLTVAFGWSGEINVLDIRCMLDIERFCKVNVNAKCRAEIFPGKLSTEVQNNVGFLARCVRRFPRLNLVNRNTGRIYASFAGGKLEQVDGQGLASVVMEPEIRNALYAVAPDLFEKRLASAALGSKTCVS